MNLLPKEFVPLILMFAPLFSKRVWEGAVVLLVGAILAPGERTVSAILRVMGREQERQFQRYHRVLNRAVWSSRQASRVLQQVVNVFAPSGVLVMGIDDTIERRRGNYTPRLTLAKCGQPYVRSLVTPTDNSFDMRVRRGEYPPGDTRGCPHLSSVIVALQIASCTAVWYHTGLPPVPIRWVLIQDPQGRFPTQALLCTDLSAQPQQILQWFRWRWQLEVTFEEVRTHLGVESQRQWSPLAILRTTPALLALFSIVVMLAHQAQSLHPFQLPHTAWYDKPLPTFSDAKRPGTSTPLARSSFSVVYASNRYGKYSSLPLQLLVSLASALLPNG